MKMSTAVPAATQRRMTVADLDRVLAIEAAAYSFPWSRGNFIDSLAAGYAAETLRDPRDDTMVGYFVAMPGVDELHLLNLTVAPAHQRLGHARVLLEAVADRARALVLRSIWLEVRVSNERAQQVYRAGGFTQVGLRRGYYPAGSGRREDAVVMTLPLQPAAEASDDVE